MRKYTSFTLRHDEDTDTYRFKSSGRDSVGVEIVLAVAEITGTGPIELEPMADFVDTDLLDELFRDQRQQWEAVSFDYLGFRVTVYCSGEVVLQPDSGSEVRHTKGSGSDPFR